MGNRFIFCQWRDIMKNLDYTPSNMKEITIEKMVGEKLFTNLCIPSTIHSYSLCIEYIKKWFLEKFDSTYFKSIHVDGKHIFDDYRRFNKTEMLKRQKPALAIVPTIDNDFDREKVDLSVFGLDMFIQRSGYDNAFFKDKSKKVYLGIIMEAISMNYTFRVKVSTRSQAIDLLKFMRMAFRIGVTQGKDIDMDFHIPYDLMIRLAGDSGFIVDKDNTIVDIVGFLCYLNKNSQIPFLYKMRNINGNNEFFIRIKDLYVHISTPDINSDDGEREGVLMTNFIIEMQSTVRFPCPKFYTYFSHKEHEELKYKNDDGSINSYLINLANIPDVNSKGWNQFMSTECEENDLSTILEIHFEDLIGDLRDIIEYTKSLYLSPSLFMDIKLFNDNIEKDISIDWENMLLKTKKLMTNTISHISIYVDTEYMNDQLINMKKYNESRL